MWTDLLRAVEPNFLGDRREYGLTELWNGRDRKAERVNPGLDTVSQGVYETHRRSDFFGGRGDTKMSEINVRNVRPNGYRKTAQTVVLLVRSRAVSTQGSIVISGLINPSSLFQFYPKRSENLFE